MSGSSAHTLEQSLTDREPVSTLSVSVCGAGPTGALLALGLANWAATLRFLTSVEGPDRIAQSCLCDYPFLQASAAAP